MLAVKDPAEERPKPGIGSSTPCKEDTMKKLIVLPAVLLLLACQDHNPVQPEPEAAPELALVQARGGPGNVTKMVPFKGEGTWRVVGFEPVVEDDVMKVFVEIEGTATHLGRFQWELMARYVLVVLGHDEDGNPIYYKTDYLSHSGIFTAANGDELYDEGCVDEHGTVNVPDDFFGFFMTGIHFVGGTGRFANAEGSYDFLVIATVPPDPFPSGTWMMEGEISTVGSSKR